MPSSPDRTILRGRAADAVARYQPGAFTPREDNPSSLDLHTPTGSSGVHLADVYAEELARIRAQAHAEGYAAGHQEGIAAAEQSIAAARDAAQQEYANAQAAWDLRLSAAVAALTNAAARLDATTQPLLDDLAETVCATAYTLLGDLLDKELAVAENPGVDAIRRAVTASPDDAPVSIRLHPDDYAALPVETLDQLPSTVSLRPDPAVERAGAIAEAGAQRIDAQIGTALARVRAALDLP